MVEGLRIGRMRLAPRNLGATRTAQPAVKSEAIEDFGGPTDGDLFHIQNSSDGIGRLKFTLAQTPVGPTEEPSSPENNISSTSEYDFCLSGEEQAVMNLLKPLAPGITQKRITILINSVVRKVQERQIEKEEDRVKDEMRTTVEKSDPEIIASRQERRKFYLERDNQFRRAKAKMERAKKDAEKEKAKAKEEERKQQLVESTETPNPTPGEILYTQSEIAGFYGRSRQRIHQIVKKLEFPNPRRLTEEQAQMVVAHLRITEQDKVA